MKLELNSDLNGTDISAAAPQFSNYPNPFSSETSFAFDRSDGSREIIIFNIQGHKVFSQEIPEGETSFLWNAEGLPDGLYIAKLVSGNADYASIKLILQNK